MSLPAVDPLETASEILRTGAAAVGAAIGAGPAHRYRLSNIDHRIVVSGVRGKTTAVNWLHDTFTERGYDTFSKTTGERPVVRYNDETRAVTRSERVYLYENERELRQSENIDVLIVENQGIRPYTTRLVNEQFVHPHVVFLTNVREDHLGTLGDNREQITRALARTVPAGTPVVSGVRDPDLRAYLEAELHRRDAAVTHADTPASVRSIPGSELVYGVDHLLTLLGERGLSKPTIDDRLGEMQVDWISLPRGRVLNAAMVNDVQSTEIVRKASQTREGQPVVPILNLRDDRRGRTVSFLRYLEWLADAGIVERVHLVGDRESQALFARHADVPVVRYDTTEVSPEVVLNQAFDGGDHVMLLGNAVTPFMQEMETIIEELAQSPTPPSTRTQHTVTQP